MLGGGLPPNPLETLFILFGFGLGALEVPLLAQVGYPGSNPFGTGWVPWKYSFLARVGYPGSNPFGTGWVPWK